MDIETTLQYLNDEYLSGFKRTGAVNSEIPLQNAFARTQKFWALILLELMKLPKIKLITNCI